MRDIGRSSVEHAIADVRGDSMLLLLAIGQIEEHAQDARDLNRIGDSGRLEMLVPERSLTALAHAHWNLAERIKKLEAAFFGEEQG